MSFYALMIVLCCDLNWILLSCSSPGQYFSLKETGSSFTMGHTKAIRIVDLRLRGGEHTELEILKNSTSSISTAGIEILPRRRQPPRPKCGDIVVPDHTPNVLSAVLAVKEGGTIFVREGTYHWSEEDTGNESRSIDHNFGGQNDAANGRAFVGRKVTVR
eukprot:CAMPEP_0172164540 /NCGR_PEP_ID=MMETSP1050-20130122/7900_1 /TAXON_ID=233186 /ORGANISM="Cryptomonas curvata, Strain CCAP979/52" /LENGTH=159 /DNA_ID=CAMNT_0012834885 /DNA_START=96 /DNA_END=571 /DNA_ORIENTATION=-